MVIGLYVGMVVVVAALIANLSLTFAVIQRIRDIESTSRPGSTPEPAPKPGHVLKDFRAESLSGTLVDRETFARGKSRAFFFMVNCAPCSRMIDAISSGTGPDQGRTVFFVTGDPESEKAAEMTERLRGHGEMVLLGTSQHEALTAFGGVQSFPRVVSLRDGVVTRAEASLPAPSTPDGTFDKVPA